MMLFRYLRACGSFDGEHIVISMMPRGPIADMIAGLGVEVVDLNAGKSWQVPLAIAKLGALLRRRAPTVVHGWMYHGSLIATLALMSTRRSGVGLIWAIHHSLSDAGNEKPTTRAVLRALRGLAARADAITYCSRESGRQHTAFGLPADRMHFVPNAIDMREFRPDATARARVCAAANLPADRIIVGAVSRAHPMKDHATFARTIAILAGRGINVHGLLIGEGQPEGAAVRVASQAGITDRLTALPARSDVAALVPGFDLYLLSSAWGEALPLAVAEAMAAGIPAVVTDVGDCGWLVGATGRVCPPQRPDLLADATQHLLSLPQDCRAALSNACRDRIAQTLSMPEYVVRHATLYEHCRDSRRARSHARPPEAA